MLAWAVPLAGHVGQWLPGETLAKLGAVDCISTVTVRLAQKKAVSCVEKRPVDTHSGRLRITAPETDR